MSLHAFIPVQASKIWKNKNFITYMRNQEIFTVDENITNVDD